MTDAKRQPSSPARRRESPLTVGPSPHTDGQVNRVLEEMPRGVFTCARHRVPTIPGSLRAAATLLCPILGSYWDPVYILGPGQRQPLGLDRAPRPTGATSAARSRPTPPLPPMSPNTWCEVGGRETLCSRGQTGLPPAPRGASPGSRPTPPGRGAGIASAHEHTPPRGGGAHHGVPRPPGDCGPAAS